MNQQSNFSQSALQKLFLTVFVLTIAGLVAFQVYIYGRNPFGGLESTVFILTGIVAPLVAGIIALLLHRPSNRLTRVFDAAIITVLASNCYGLISAATQRLYQMSQFNTGNYNHYLFFEALNSVITVLLVTIVLLVLKRQKRW